MTTWRRNRRDRHVKQAGEGGFTLVEVLVAMAILTSLMVMSNGLLSSVFDSWSRGQDRQGLALAGVGVLSSILQDARNAKEIDYNASAFDGKGTPSPTGTNLRLALDFPAVRGTYMGLTRWHVKRVTYENTADGFTRKVEEAWTPGPDDDPASGAALGYVRKDWVLTHHVSQFALETQFPTATSSPRSVRVNLFLHEKGYAARNGQAQLAMNGRAFIRRIEHVDPSVSF
ncbi:MAG: type II secretion system protein J [Chitinophagales bacterium]